MSGGSGALAFPRWLLGVARGRATWVTALLIVQSLGSGLGILILLPMLALIGIGDGNGASDSRLGALDSALRWAGVEGSLVAILVLYVFVNAVTALSRALATEQASRMREQAVLNVRRRAYRAAMTARWGHASRRSESELTHVLTAEAGRIGLSTDLLVRFVSAFVILLAYVAVALVIVWWGAALAVVGGVGLILLLRKGRRRSTEAGLSVSRAVAALYSAVGGHLGGRKTIRVHGLEQESERRFAALAESVGVENFRLRRAEAWSKAAFEVGAVLALAIFVFVFVEVAAGVSSALLVTLYLAARTLKQLDLLHEGLVRYLAQVPAFTRTWRIIEELERHAEIRVRAGRAVPFSMERDIRLDNVSVCYEGSEKPAVRGLELTLRAGRTTALVGASGGGKTTTADVVAGLLQPTSGRVLIDAVELSDERRAGWLAQLAYVGQDAPLFPGSIRENLQWGSPDATEQEMWTALEQADARAFVEELGHGLDTDLGDDGARISGGQGQRLVLARALVRRPALLILDEATSQLDAESEQRIQNTLVRLRGGTTILMISHRLASVRRADVIVVLREGNVVEQGSFAELMEREDGVFRAMCAAQGVTALDALEGDSGDGDSGDHDPGDADVAGAA